MIETQEAVQNIDEILSVKDLNGVYIGPADMSLAYGLKPKFDVKEDPIFSNIKLIVNTSKEHGKIAGIHNGTTQYAKEMIALGYQFVTISSDYNASINSTYTSRTTVLQIYEPKISIVGEDTMSAKPEEQVNFTIKIANDGNGEDDISLSLVGGNASWGQLGDSAFTLAAGTNDTTTLRVTPPRY